MIVTAVLMCLVHLFRHKTLRSNQALVLSVKVEDLLRLTWNRQYIQITKELLFRNLQARLLLVVFLGQRMSFSLVICVTAVSLVMRLRSQEYTRTIMMDHSTPIKVSQSLPQLSWPITFS